MWLERLAFRVSRGDTGIALCLADVQSCAVGRNLNSNAEESTMPSGCVLSDYIEHAMAAAVYDKLEDGSFAGRVPKCRGVVAFAATLVGCQNLLRSTFEDWLFLGLKLGHEIPVLSGIDLNGEPVREPLDAV